MRGIMFMSRYEPRTYRRRIAADGLAAFRVVRQETDLHVQVALPPQTGGEEGGLERIRQAAQDVVEQARGAIRTEISLRGEFLSSHEPLPERPGARAPVPAMYAAGRLAGVGPMAAVAGAVAQYVGGALLELASEVIVENGGDVFLGGGGGRTVAVHAGRSPLNGRVGIVLPTGEGLGVCTSSGTVGHSHSEGRADAAVVVASDAALADAVATALGNRVTVRADLDVAVEWAMSVPGVRQALVIIDDALAVAGEFELARLR